jgi:hypothetical protein
VKGWPCAFPALAGVLGVFGCARGSAPSPPNEFSPEGTPSASTCTDPDCTLLDSECRHGVCISGICSAEPAREGEPCAVDGPCGEALCAAGRCVAREPPDCSALDDACYTGRCDLREGCVAEPNRVAGATCSDAIEVTGTLRGRAEGECGTTSALLGEPAGLAAYFALDLRHLEHPTPVSLLLGSGLPLASALFQGSCEDPSVVVRGDDGNWFGDPGEVELSALLDPARYWVVAASTQSGKAPVELAGHLDGAFAEAPLGASCTEPLPLEAELGVHVYLEHVAGPAASPAPSCDRFLIATSTCYVLDLSARTEETLIRIELGGMWGQLFRAGVDEVCGELLGQAHAFSAMLTPDRYFFGVDAPTDKLFSFKTVLSDSSECGSEPNDSCKTAIDLDVTRSTHALQGNTACHRHALRNDPATEASSRLFYRLDLSEFGMPTRLAPSSPDELPRVTVIEEDEDRSCTGTSDWASSYVVAPGVYYLVVEGSWGDAFEFELELTPALPSGRSDCIPSDVVGCALHSSSACRELGLAAPECVAVLEPCGLSWPPLADLCATAPECCGEREADASTDCVRLFEQAGARCDDCVGDYCWFDES